MTRSSVEQLCETLRRHVQEEGLLPQMKRTGIPLGQLRSVLIGRMPHVDTVEHITAALGMEFYIGRHDPVRRPRRWIPAPSNRRRHGRAGSARS